MFALCGPWSDLHTLNGAPKEQWVRLEPLPGIVKHPTSLTTVGDFPKEKAEYDEGQCKMAETTARKPAKEAAAKKKAAKKKAKTFDDPDATALPSQDSGRRQRPRTQSLWNLVNYR